MLELDKYPGSEAFSPEHIFQGWRTTSRVSKKEEIFNWGKIDGH